MAMGFNKMLRFLSLKHLLMLSMALNLSLLLSRLIAESESLRFKIQEDEKSQENDHYCLVWGTRDNTCDTSTSDQSTAHVSKNTSPAALAEDVEVEKVIQPDSVIINLDHGDPTMYEQFWKKTGEKATIVIPGWQSLSYFSDISNVCWFLEPEFAGEVRRLHKLVGNANTDDRHIVVGTGSTQLYMAALYALAPTDTSKQPISVVSAAPFYSSYPLMTDFLKSGLYKWGGDAYTFNREEPYIELITSPNNPDGFTRKPVVNGTSGILVHDLAYYWPQYTPITSQLDHELLLFTVSKSTGHAGTRIGWALVKDKDIAQKMTKFIELNTIGVSKDSQLRAAKILRAVSDSCTDSADSESFFEFGHRLMTQRWKQLRDAVRTSGLFSLPQFTSDFCNYYEKYSELHPAFAWLRCEGDIEDCEKFLRDHKIITRSGKHFGRDIKFVRVSMLDRDKNFGLFVERLSNITSETKFP
ncbi:hypothetical protein MKW92_031000 [Papaver armeniacum]|nr:hypothetical protein MKW92_031000 [Papaver armeniacum]